MLEKHQSMTTRGTMDILPKLTFKTYEAHLLAKKILLTQTMVVAYLSIAPYYTVCP